MDWHTHVHSLHVDGSIDSLITVDWHTFAHCVSDGRKWGNEDKGEWLRKMFSVSIKRCKEIMQSVTIEVGYVGFESIKVDAKNKNICNLW